MRDEHAVFEAAGARIVVVVTAERDEVAAYWKEHGLPYLGVADPEGVLTRSYGQQWKLFRMGRMPAQFVIGCDGTIAFAHYGSSMSDIPENAAMLELLRTLPRCGG